MLHNHLYPAHIAVSAPLQVRSERAKRTLDPWWTDWHSERILKPRMTDTPKAESANVRRASNVLPMRIVTVDRSLRYVPLRKYTHKNFALHFDALTRLCFFVLNQASSSTQPMITNLTKSEMTDNNWAVRETPPRVLRTPASVWAHVEAPLEK